MQACYSAATDFWFAVFLSGGTATSIDVDLFFVAFAVGTAWSAARVVSFTSAQLLVADPLPPHHLSFAVWVVRYRSWSAVADVLGVGCLQLSALDILTCRAVGPVDGPLSASIVPRAADALQAHSTAVGLLRSFATLIVVADLGDLLRPIVFLKLVAAGSSCVLGVSALLLRRLLQRRHAKTRVDGGLSLSHALLPLLGEHRARGIDEAQRGTGAAGADARRHDS